MDILFEMYTINKMNDDCVLTHYCLDRISSEQFNTKKHQETRKK